jgi:hypothetical protein
MDIELGGISMTQSSTYNPNKHYIPVNQSNNQNMYRPQNNESQH